MCGSVIWDSELWKLPDHEFLRKIYTLCVCVCVCVCVVPCVKQFVGSFCIAKGSLACCSVITYRDGLRGWEEGSRGRCMPTRS